MQQILKTYLKRLTNLTARNRSLLLTQLPVEQFLDLHELDFLDGKPSFDLVNQLINQKENISLCAVLDSRFEKINLLSKHLSKIARTEQFIKNERGAEDLYVGFPMVQGKFADGTVVRAPLLFFPVTLVTKSPRFSETLRVSETQALKWHLRQRDEPITLNRSFLLAYGHFNQTPIPDELLEKSFDDFDKDSLAFLTQLYEFLKTSPIELNFNQALFQRQLIHFEKLTKPDLEQTEKNGELKLYPQAVLGIFPQAGSYLAPDYEELLRPPVNASLLEEDNAMEDLKFFFQKSSISGVHSLGGKGHKHKEESLLTPLPVDASQEQALQLVKQGASLVVQGPPGTGKSQLIANLIADFTARGKKVLLVCQKRVALDTVYERLKRLGMSSFVALVHDFKNDRKALYQQLANQIEQVETYQKQNNSLDAIVIERDYLQNCRRIDQLSDELQSLKNALFDESVCGLSVKELYLTSNPNEPHVALDNLYQSFHFQEISDFIRRLDAYQVYAQRVNIPTHPWAERVDFSEIRFAEIPKIEAVLNDIPVFVQHLAERAEPFTYREVQTLLNHRYTLETAAEHLAEPTVYQLFNKLRTDKDFSSQFVKLQDETNDYQQKGLLQPLRTDELGSFSALLSRGIEARRSVFNWWFFSEKQALQTVASTCGLSTDLPDLQTLEQLLANRLSFERCIEAFKELCGLDKTLKFNLLSVTIQQYEHFCKQWDAAQQAHDSFKQIPSFLQDWLHSALDFSTFQTRLATLLDLLDDFNQKQIYWQQYLTESQIETIVEQPTLITTLSASLRQDFEMLHEADTLKKNFSRVEAEVVSKLSAHVPELHKENIELLPLFQNSLRLAWIAHIEAKYPILQGVSSLKIKQVEAELQTAVQKKQALSREILLLKLREHTYKNLEVNRLQNVVTYRNLKHQVTKKRNIWAIRHLLAELSEEVFPLVPCWMASPEAVSAVFPLTSQEETLFDDENASETQNHLDKKSGRAIKKVFDLVIFDEASQCFAEHGLPALYRGQQVVIAGDSKQLQPTDLYRIRFEQEAEELPELEIDSLLDLATQYLPQAQLTGHYRSQSLDLIDFSNQHFYKNSLQLLPHFEEINRLTPAIHYLKVAGIWQNNTNEIEAQRIVELVQKLAIKEPHLSVGIVTFNHQQQALIQELLEVKNEERGVWNEANSEQSANSDLQSGLGGLASPKLITDTNQAIFVKNIENVQGDERDVIIFSVAYAPDAKGRMAMQFGSLNMAGGENRLNVAVTRARRRVYVVASIMPHQLLVEGSVNEGPKLLKKYLQYALDVSEGRYKPQPKSTEAFRQEWMLKERLNHPPAAVQTSSPPFGSYTYPPHKRDTLSGLQLSFELPFADLTVKNGEQYDSLILTDDDLYYQGLSPKEAHAYLPINLQEKGWKFQRIWSREWWKMKNKSL